MQAIEIIIPYLGNESIPLPHVIQVLVGNDIVKMRDSKVYANSFISGHDLSILISAEKRIGVEKI